MALQQTTAVTSRSWSPGYLTFCAFLVMLTAPRITQAQNRNDLLKGLLRTLIESQLEDRQRDRDPRPPRNTPTPQMQRLRPLARDFSTEATSLAQLLHQEMRSTPNVRPGLAATLRVRADAAVLATRAAEFNSHERLIPDIRKLDRDWRKVAHQLRRVPGLEEACLQCIARLDEFDTRLCQAVGIAPQFDRQELVRQLGLLEVYFRNLSDEIRVELPDTAVSRQAVVATRNFSTRVRVLATLVAQGSDYDSVAAEYQRFSRDWNTLAIQLESAHNRFIERDLQRIQTTMKDVRQTLWLPVTIDMHEVETLITGLGRSIDDLLRSLTIHDVILLPNADQVMPTADEFHGVYQHLQDCAARGETPDALRDAWEHVDRSWQVFAYYIGPVQSRQTRTAAQFVDRMVENLRLALAIERTFDLHELSRLGTSIEGFAHQIAANVERWQARAGTRNSAIARRSRSFHEIAHHFDEAVDAHASRDHLKRDCTEMFELWTQLRRDLATCQTPERDILLRLSAQTTPTIVELEALLAL